MSQNSFHPEKKRVTDSGFDIYGIEYNEIKPGIYELDFRLAISPPPGYFFMLTSRSSLPKHNIRFINGIGIIDQTYIGSIKTYVEKINSEEPLPELPLKCGQLIPLKFLHVDTEEVDSLEETDRGSDGFGSTG